MGGGTLLITMQCKQPAAWTDMLVFSLCLHATLLSATVFYLRDSTNYETHVWPPFFNSLLQTDALISNYINLPISSSPFFIYFFLISHAFVSHFSTSTSLLNCRTRRGRRIVFNFTEIYNLADKRFFFFPCPYC